MFLCITFFFYDIKSVAFIFADYHTTCLKCIKGGGGGGKRGKQTRPPGALCEEMRRSETIFLKIRIRREDRCD